MKKFKLLLLLTLLSFFSIGKDSYLNITSDKRKNGWALSNEPCYGCGSFYYRILRTGSFNENGEYAYLIQMYSNSFDDYGVLKPTYVKNVSALIDGDTVKTVEYVVVDVKKQEIAVRILNKDPGAQIELGWEKVRKY